MLKSEKNVVFCVYPNNPSESNSSNDESSKKEIKLYRKYHELIQNCEIISEPHLSAINQLAKTLAETAFWIFFNCAGDKLSENKKIFTNNDCLEKQICMKECEISELNKKINELLNNIKNSEIQNGNLKNTLDSLNALKCEQTIKITKLIEDNKALNSGYP